MYVSSKIFRLTCAHFKLKTTVDLFASQLNYQCKHYFSFTPDMYCSYVDTFTMCWKDEKSPYMYPPFNLLHMCLVKIKREWLEKVLLVCPAWPNQPSFSTMLNMLVDASLLLQRYLKNMLIFHWDLNMTDPNLKNLQMLFIMLSDIDILLTIFSGRKGLS